MVVVKIVECADVIGDPDASKCKLTIPIAAKAVWARFFMHTTSRNQVLLRIDGVLLKYPEGRIAVKFRVLNDDVEDESVPLREVEVFPTSSDNFSSKLGMMVYATKSEDIDALIDAFSADKCEFKKA